MLTNATLRSKVDALWDRFWSGGISNPLTAIGQMSYLIFLLFMSSKPRRILDKSEKYFANST